MPGFPLGAALIDLPHDHAQGADQHEGGGHGEKPFAQFCVHIGRAGTVQEGKAAASCGGGAYQQPDGQQAVGLMHLHAPPSGLLSTPRPV